MDVALLLFPLNLASHPSDDCTVRWSLVSESHEVQFTVNRVN